MPELITYFAVLPFAVRDDGRIICDETAGVECPSAEAAVQLLQEMARAPGYSTAVAFARTGRQ